MSRGPLRIVLVDDHEMVLAGLNAVLARHTELIEVVGEARSPDEAVRRVRQLDPDIVLSDVRLGRFSGLDLCQRLVQEDPRRKVVLLTVYDDERYLRQGLRAGAVGYLLKQIDATELVRQLERVVAGEIVIDSGTAGRVAADAARLQAGEFWPGAHLGLTERESEVLGLIVTGLSNRGIAQRLVLGEETVKSHVRSIYRKLDVTGRTDALAAAIREGMFP